MAKFLKGNELNAELSKVFENAKERLIIISPYIKLHHRFADILKDKIKNDKLEIIIVFGKNEKDISKSMAEEDLNFFKQFPNIHIRYEKRLHAKFYANETEQIITSMNLYDYSQDENIEVGIKTEFNLLGSIANKILGDKSVDQEAWNYFLNVIEKSEVLYWNTPQYESALLGINKKYAGSKVTTDKISEHFNSNTSKSTFSNEKQTKGYCIRTGVEIPFDLKKPFCLTAYREWAKYKDPNYPEKFCHKTGKQSFGKTSLNNPILIA